MSMLGALWRNKRDGVVGLGVLLAVFLLVGLLVMGPLLQRADRYRAELLKDSRILQELRAVEAVQDEIKRAQQSYEERNLKDWVYADRSADQVGLDVQKRTSTWLAGVQVQRITPVSRAEDEGYTAVGVEVQFVASLVELMRVLNEIEQSRPLLVVDRLRINPVQQQGGYGNSSEAAQHLSVYMLVQTYIPTRTEP